MDPISNADRLASVLRQKLLERSKSAAAQGARKRESGGNAATGVHALAAIEGIDERQLRRTLLQSLLAEEFGAELINQAQFQQVVDRVLDTIEQDQQATNLLSRVIRDIRAPRR